jgi:hypothetical protein
VKVTVRDSIIGRLVGELGDRPLNVTVPVYVPALSVDGSAEITTVSDAF